MDPSDVVNIITDLLVRYSLQVLAGLAIFAAGVVCARLTGRVLERWLQRTAIDLHLQHLIIKAAKGLVLLFTLIMCLEKVGVQVTALVAGVSLAGVAGGFALQGVLGNVAAGLSIMFSRPFRIGDYIEIGNTKGQVQSIDLSMTVLRTLEDARVLIPNRKIVGEIILNYTAERRVVLNVEVGYGEDLEMAMRTIQEVLAENPRILKTPAPQVGITKLGDSGIEVALRPWCKAEDFWPIHFEVYRSIVDRFREQHIEIPFPQREVRLLNTAA